jgi:hypothetical protein
MVVVPDGTAAVESSNRQIEIILKHVNLNVRGTEQGSARPRKAREA